MSQFCLPHDHGQPMENVLHCMPAAEEFTTVAEVFRQLGDSSRVRIFWLLCHCEECVINISACVGMSSPAVSHHLRQLKAAGLIVSRRSGKEVYYRAAATQCARLLHDMIEQLVAIACPLPTAPSGDLPFDQTAVLSDDLSADTPVVPPGDPPPDAPPTPGPA